MSESKKYILCFFVLNVISVCSNMIICFGIRITLNLNATTSLANAIKHFGFCNHMVEAEVPFVWQHFRQKQFQSLAGVVNNRDGTGKVVYGDIILLPEKLRNLKAQNRILLVRELYGWRFPV